MKLDDLWPIVGAHAVIDLLSFWWGRRANATRPVRSPVLWRFQKKVFTAHRQDRRRPG
ncbi:MAG TPA: hypothetical protein PKD73_05555 [Burkholderiaceae bacterium]|nr:hypothetical protein [Burkholderiaceae bacterium]